ncbi:Hsp20/alpha crystallin family protein [Oscillatoria sp. FACHB-1407]|uniref:Hsp20/alpha crystallin family protein n=1 Tax=Oscillatoria sp. FACHB-1407 TaxID=2692847 RepID=UPI00168878BD|nr:Hsp20/alpha crystallin family protein [Oscillatoria sp. FACHB-1407]MBD2463758.1 Hsp20/alpha crystallin family protein [Oscillatoria sp. FACHB-1407]
MALVRWAPFREIETLQRELNQLFDTLGSDATRADMVSFTPSAEIHETPEAIQLRVEIPGIDAKDLDIQVMADAVSISGERKSETRTEDKGVIRSEFRYGSFRRVVPMPTRIQNDKVKAEYKDGILSLTLPKVEEEKNKVVKVNLA